MSDFIEIPASKRSLSRRKKVCGVGINDADYITNPYIDKKRSMCAIFKRWKGMLARCYVESVHKKYPTYSCCSVSSEWLMFSNFRAWMIKQDWKGMQLDKDIVSPGNKIYSPENCRFITSQLNSLLNDHAAKRGPHPQGVDFHKPTGKYRVRVRIGGMKKHIGLFLTPELASNAYIKIKTALILKAASEQTDPAIANGLMLHAELLKST